LSAAIREVKVSLVLSNYADADHPPRLVVDAAKKLAASRVTSMRAIEVKLKNAIRQS
jgi:hypothetical protein